MGTSAPRNENTGERKVPEPLPKYRSTSVKATIGNCIAGKLRNEYSQTTAGTNNIESFCGSTTVTIFVSNSLSDDAEIEREIHNMFVRCNTLTRKFSKCSLNAKVTVFRSYCSVECIQDWFFTEIWLMLSQMC